MDAAGIIQSLMAGLKQALSTSGAELAGEYPAQPLPAKPRTALITVGIGHLAEALDVRITVFTPFEEGAQRCEALYQTIDSAVWKLGLEGCQGTERKGVGYDARTRTCTLELVVHFRPMLQFRYAGTPLSCYAETLRITGERMLKKYYAPMVGEVVQNLGLCARVITGQGEIRRAGREDSSAGLDRLFRETGQGQLTLPNGEGMEAVFSKFVPVFFPNGIRYDFEFVEVPVL